MVVASQHCQNSVILSFPTDLSRRPVKNLRAIRSRDLRELRANDNILYDICSIIPHGIEAEAVVDGFHFCHFLVVCEECSSRQAALGFEGIQPNRKASLKKNKCTSQD